MNAAALLRGLPPGLGPPAPALPPDAVIPLPPARAQGDELRGRFFSASLDHAMWFPRPMRADEWHVQTFTCHGLMSSRGVSLGYVFTPDGTHVATVVQEVLLRKVRDRTRG